MSNTNLLSVMQQQLNEALATIGTIRATLAAFTGKSPDEVNPVADLTAMFETVVNQSDELGMIDYNGYKAKLAAMQLLLYETNEKAQWWENEARQSGKLFLMVAASADRLRSELATVTSERDAAIEALIPFAEQDKHIQDVAMRMGRVYVRSHWSLWMAQNTSYLEHISKSITIAHIQQAAQVVTAHHKRQRPITDVMLNPEVSE